MKKDEIIRLRVTAAQKARWKENAEKVGDSLSGFVTTAAQLRCAEIEHGSATRIKTNDVKIPEPVQLSDGVTLGQKKSYGPDPK